jgi:hypothetical protein
VGAGPHRGPDAPLNAVLFSLANGLLVLNVAMLFLGARRPPYDRLAGTVVQRGRDARDAPSSGGS